MGPKEPRSTVLSAEDELHERATRVAADVLRRLIEAVPYRIHTVLTDNGTHFTNPNKGNSPTLKEVKRLLAEKTLFRCQAFVLACARNEIDHRLTEPNHPWTNGQVKRIARKSLRRRTLG